MILFGIGQVGCSPNELALHSEDGTTCVEHINTANQMFNSKLKSLVDQLSNELPDSKVIFVNSYGIFQDIISNPSSYGNLTFCPISFSLFTLIKYEITWTWYLNFRF